MTELDGKVVLVGLAYFSGGLTEELLHTLSQRTELKIVGRASSFSLRGPDKAIPNAAHIGAGEARRPTHAQNKASKRIYKLKLNAKTATPPAPSRTPRPAARSKP